MKWFILIFSLSDRTFAFELKTVKEIVHAAALLHPTGAPDLLKGFLNLENRAVPVLSLTTLLNLAPKPDALYSQIVIHQRNQAMIAFAVDEVLEVVTFSEDQVLPVGEAYVFNGCVKGISVYKGKKVHILSWERILLEQERQTIADFQQKVQERIDQLKPTALQRPSSNGPI